jgi:hypothetical protein
VGSSKNKNMAPMMPATRTIMRMVSCAITLGLPGSDGEGIVATRG